MRARIAEVFESIQGEGIYVGEKQVFVRFFGCNLSCNFCDTKLNSFQEYSTEELFNKIKSFGRGCQSISFTGGEPLLYKDFLKEILILTSAHGYTNYLETNGTLVGELKEVINYVDIVAMDIKLPSSSGMGNLWGLHKRFLEAALEKNVFVKIVVGFDTKAGDLYKAIDLIKQADNAPVLVLQPNSSEHMLGLTDKMDYFSRICESEGIASCVIPQMHKQIGVK